ncbi:MAG: SAP domain-containing protein [Candidatus Omnitrophica bacterium]|nr:SAP domain-containing protein [Candidatus Omnitrophota bacterium]
MRLSEIMKKARSLGIKNGWMYPKTKLVKAIQRKEGNFDCFGSAKGSCNQMACCWREDCISIK